MSGENSQTRSKVHRLLARLYLAEVNGEMVGYLREVPGLAEHLPAASANMDAWLQNLKVEYQWLFGMNVYPYESVFVGDEVMVNTAATQRVVAFYRECGFQPAPDLRFGAPDHIGVEMSLMAELIDAGNTTKQSHLLHRHLAVWGPVFAQAVARTSRQSFYQALGELTIDFLLSDLENVPVPSPAPPGDIIPLQAAPPDEDDDELDLNAVVDQLLTPSRVGVFLSRQDILHLAQRLDLPAGILERSLMLKNLFRAAGQYDLIPALLDALAQRIQQAGAQYARWAEKYPAWVQHAGNWSDRTQTGLDLLDDMRATSAEFF